MKKRELKVLAEEINIFHIIIAIVTICAMILLFAYEPLRVYSAIWLMSIWLIELAYGLKCPLTIEEYNLRIKAGEHIRRKTFLPYFFKRYFHINAPDWLVEIFLTIYFIISIFILFQYIF